MSKVSFDGLEQEELRTEVLYNPDAFRVNSISYENMLINLCALLGENKLSQVTLPTNSEAEQVLTVLNSSCSKPSKLTLDEHLVIGKYYVTLITEGNLNTWYIASCEGRNDDQTYAMDHLV